MQRKTKKGFTIVELVIVIAVIGVLTAILVPTFISLTAKANKASDQSLVTNLNTALKMQEAEDGEKNPTMQDAVEDLEKQGYKLSQLVSKSKEDLVYNLKENKFYLTDATEVKNSSKKYEFWKIYKEKPALADQTFSIYAGHEWTATTAEVKVGFDAGKNENIAEVKYENDNAQEVVIRTNTPTTNLTINAEHDTVKHFGDGKVINLQAVSTSSYYENGAVAQINIKKGRLVLTNTEKTSVGTVYLQSTGESYDNIIIATQKGAELPDSIVRDNVPLPEGNDTKTVVTIQTGVNEQGQEPSKVETINLYSASDVKESTNGYDVSELGQLVVEAISAEAQEQAAQQISDPDILAKVEEPKGTFEVRSQDDLDSALLKEAKYISIMDNFTINKVINVPYSLNIEGNNKTITSSAKVTGSKRILWTDASNVSLTIRNLTFDGSKIMERGIQVSSDNVGCDIVLDNVKVLNVTHYAVNLCSNTSGTITIAGCELSGWNALNIWGFGHKINVSNSVLTGTNPYSSGSNSFATICFEADTTNVQADDYSNGNIVTINASTINAIEQGTCVQAIVSFNKGIVGALNNTLVVNNSEMNCPRYLIIPGVANGGNRMIVDNEVVWSN